MESLSPQCTPLKHRYDSCFNLWFEGYLQPALAHGEASSSSTIRDQLLARPALPFTEPEKPVSTPDQIVAPNIIEGAQPAQKKAVKSWSNAFRRRIRSPQHHATSITSDGTIPADLPYDELPPIETAGKTRTQIKAEEYDRACGSLFKDYQACLKVAIAQNSSLTTLLEQAREEHPLHSQHGLEGTPWDPGFKATD